MTPPRLDWARDGADWPNRDASRFLEAGGVRWHVQTLGPEGAPALLLVHGAGGASHSWRDVAPRLAERFRVIAPDLPGHGFSGPGYGDHASLPGMARALAALCAALGASPALIAGHSAGAAIAARMALDGLAAPRSIVSFNGAFLPFRGAAGVLFPIMAKLLALNPFVPRAMAWTAGGAAADRLLDAMGDGLDARGRALYRRLFESPGHVAAALAMMAAWDLRPLGRDLPRLRRPLALIVGERDRAVPPEDADAVAARTPGASVRRLAGLGHLAHEQAPDVAAAIVDEAWRDAGAAAESPASG